ncbi:MAG TPA: Gfo/Idh/MocA family oxidoreductase [Planctomycetaceae bacterium]|nr:Gfo/Idh/MocA family oxidoreductase [Planctomycetaceae bacterium]
MIRIGIIGIGFMGMTHFEGARKLKGARVAAIATRDRKKLAGDWTSIQGNFGPRGGHVDLSKVKKFADYQSLLADPDIDLIDICLPTDQHEKVVLASLAAGRHTLVEKSIALEIKAADRMVAAAAKAKRLLMVAHVLPFFPEFKFAAEAMGSGTYGKLRSAHFRRVISKPDWSRDMADLRKTGGPGIDLHIHDTHFIGLTCGVPKAVYSRGILERGFAQYLSTQYLYADSEKTVSCISGGISAPGLAFAHGYEINLERASLLYEYNTLGGQPVLNRPLTLITADGKVSHPKLKGGTEWCAAFTAELQAAADGVRLGKEPALLSGVLARDALKLCHLEAKSIASGKAVILR